MGQLFGTDGIRGLANQDPITPEVGLALGRGIVRFCKEKGLAPRIVIGRDTRISGQMLELAISSGILSAGGEAYLAGEMPTPGVAYLTKALGGGAGIVVSASHNPYEYNGFKVFSHQGYKLSDAEESEMEGLILSLAHGISRDHPPSPGRARPIPDAGERYAAFLANAVPAKSKIDDLKLVLDCANGATSGVAPLLFETIGLRVEALFTDPDGKNINENCGSQHTETLCQRVVESRADLGLAFDGDGDRLIAVDEKGHPLTGDQILLICAKMLKEKGQLENNIVVSTVMSNIGFRLALKDLGISQISAQVGDRNVLEEMRRSHAVLGGEDSGHIIFLQHHTTGDGLLSALQLLVALKTLGGPLSALSRLMTLYPQTLINVPVKIKPEIATVAELAKVIDEVQNRLGEKGRVLVRYSGTEPVCRVMVEGEKEGAVKEFAEKIAESVRHHLGEPDRA